MSYFLVKVLISAPVVAAASELARRSTVAGAVLVSLPLVSILAMSWLYLDTGSTQRVATLSSDVLWLDLPLLALFVVLPWLLHRRVGYWPALGVGVVATLACYAAVIGLRKVIM